MLFSLGIEKTYMMASKDMNMKTKKSHVYLPIKTYELILKEVAEYKAIIKKDPTARWVKVIVNPDDKPKKQKKKNVTSSL